MHRFLGSITNGWQRGSLAWKMRRARFQQFLDFIADLRRPVELRPDLIAHGRYYLDDPDGLQKKINDAAHAGEDLEYRDLRLTHRGLMLGAGPHFQAEYAQKKTEKN